MASQQLLSQSFEGQAYLKGKRFRIWKSREKVPYLWRNSAPTSPVNLLASSQSPGSLNFTPAPTYS
jgi:hypothetical protein